MIIQFESHCLCVRFWITSLIWQPLHFRCEIIKRNTATSKQHIESSEENARDDNDVDNNWIETRQNISSFANCTVNKHIKLNLLKVVCDSKSALDLSQEFDKVLDLIIKLTSNTFETIKPPNCKVSITVWFVIIYFCAQLMLPNNNT